jgi:hypothetical protein
MNSLRDQVLGYFETLSDYIVSEKADDFLVIDHAQVGGIIDTRLTWILEIPEYEDDIRQLERKLLREFETRTRQYPNSSLWLVADSFGGLSRPFRSEADRYNVNWRVPIQLFDTNFKVDGSRDIQSAIKPLREAVARIPQPFSLLANNEAEEAGEDLLEHLWNDLRYSQESKLRIVVGPAGVGKTMLFKALFSRLYEHFLKQKNAQEHFPRPIPFVPEHLRKIDILRTQELVDSFISAEVVTRISRTTFEWLVVIRWA